MFYEAAIMTWQFWRLVGLHYRDLQDCIVSINKSFCDALSNVILQFICSFI